MICHGQGAPEANLFDGGCCKINGQVCPLRWFIDYSTSSPPGDTGTATIVDSTGASLGTVNTYIATIINGKPRQDRARAMIQGAVYVCGGLTQSLANDGIPSGANWEAELNAQWSAIYDPGGSGEAVGDHWVSIGRPRNWCVVYGPGEGQCCFAEDAATNAARAAVLHVDRVTIANRNMEA